MSKSDNYKLTAAGKKLFKVLINPEYLGESVTFICHTADISRETYYRMMKDKQFTDLVSETSKELVMGKMGDVINASYIHALGEKGHQDRKMLLTMGGLYSDKHEIEHSGAIDVSAKADVISKYLKDDNDDN